MVKLLDHWGRPITPYTYADRRQYAAAKTTRLTGDWQPVGQSVNWLIDSSNQRIRNRVRQLVRDFPYFARAVNVLVNFTVGRAITYQARIKAPDGSLQKQLNQQMEDAFNFWADEADIAGKLHFHDMMRLCKRQDVEIGEFLLVKVNSPERGRFCPFALQVYEADWLDSRNDTYAGYGKGVTATRTGTETWQGIEYDTGTGRILAYNFIDPDGWGKAVKIDAADVIHGFETLRPGQLRGVSPFAPAVLVTHDLSDFMDAEMDAAKMAAKWLGFIETPDPAGFQVLRAIDNPNDPTQRLEEIENAILEYLRPGEKVTLASHDRPGSNFGPFTSLILRMVAVTVGVSYELLTGDYQGLNYSVLRGIRNDLIQEFRPIQARHVRQFCWPIFKAALDSMVLAGRLRLPDYFSNPYPYLKCQWMPAGMPPIDPLKEGRADADAIASLLKSPQECAAARGRDYEEILDEIADARRMQEERGLSVEDVTKSTKSNPGSLMDEDEEDSSSQSEPRAAHLSVIRR